MLRPLLITLAAALAIAGCGGDDKPERLSQAEFDAITAFYGATIETPQDGADACDKVRAFEDSDVMKALAGYCTDGVNIQIGVQAATLATRRFCPDGRETSEGCVTSIRALRTQYARLARTLQTYNAEIEDALAPGDCRADLRDTDASRMGPFLDNMDTAIEALSRRDTSPLEQLGALPDQDPNTDLRLCRPT